jgi:hypothetical protein
MTINIRDGLKNDSQIRTITTVKRNRLEVVGIWCILMNVKRSERLNDGDEKQWRM